MTSLAARRHPGLAMRPALFLFALLMPLALLVGCRQQGEWHQFEGVALGTGYHITLNGELGEDEHALVEAAIQGELASLDSQMDVFQSLLSASRLPLAGAHSADAVDSALREHLQALAVDRLFRVFDDFGIANAMVEFGGVQRARGTTGRHPWRVRLPRSGIGSSPEPALRLQDVALVTRTVLRPAGVEDAATSLVLSVSAVAASAEAADRLARGLLDAAPDGTLEHPARLVVLTPQGLELHIGYALEPLLEAE
ncbi:MAG: FAD:protein FMN transferase [Halomonas sp.]|uniref:FAD:protein FMN transferase n=1 Tax=Halomonas sp. TaxID=1486246 RepID=UPI0019F8A75C|nr:FAD:protein FMN transferase [Halomonas sp.]MBE0487446.1 FAD:protein FMN transferase [Halomonas sp.]